MTVPGSCYRGRSGAQDSAHRAGRRSRAPRRRPRQAEARHRRLFEEPRRSVMIARLLREERGMVLGLAIIVVVIGVVGAGLLTFVSADLQAVVAVNRGEQAFELAE